MGRENTPSYAVFDDYRYNQRVAVLVRWFVIVTWLFLHNYYPNIDATYYVHLSLVLAVAVLNAYVHWRIWQGRPITRRYVVALSAMDLTFITIGIFTSSGFGNTFFVLYYPALLGVSLVFSSRRFSFGVVSVVALVYAALSIALEPGVDFDNHEEKVLGIRLATMFAVVAAANLMTRIEMSRRRQAVEAERVRAEENLELQKKAQEAEVAALQERTRIAREIHDGIAQSIYMLSLNLETCLDLSQRDDGRLNGRLKDLVPLAKQTLLETRHYIYDLKPMLAGERGLVDMAQNQVKEFQTVSGIPVELCVHGEPRELSVAAGAGVYRILQEALVNVLKHAGASTIQATLTFDPDRVGLTVQDDGAGFRTEEAVRGNGLDNMRQRAQELDGSCKVLSVPGEGTCVMLTLPA